MKFGSVLLLIIIQILYIYSFKSLIISKNVNNYQHIINQKQVLQVPLKLKGRNQIKSRLYNTITPSSQNQNQQEQNGEISLADRITKNLYELNENENSNLNNKINRVIECWINFSNGNKIKKYLDDEKLILQEADCYVPNLDALSFHDINDENKYDNYYKWVKGLEKQYKIIYKELKNYQSKINYAKTNHEEWLPPRDSNGEAYGPEWKTMGLQDRGKWDNERIEFFPKTKKILTSLNVPSCEVFFARQGPNSGIKPHTDKNNFIITCHIGLDVPENECWIKVGNEEYKWKNGQGVVFDTSIEHSTQNISNKDRYVLLIRFWHPQLTLEERDAFNYIFDLLDYSAYGEEALSNFENSYIIMGKDKPIHNNMNNNNNCNNSNELFEDENGKRKRKNKTNYEKTNKSKLNSKGFG